MASLDYQFQDHPDERERLRLEREAAYRVEQEKLNEYQRRVVEKLMMKVTILENIVTQVSYLDQNILCANPALLDALQKLVDFQNLPPIE